MLSFARYLQWADGKLFEMLEPIPPEDWTRELGGSFSTLLATASHHFWALEVWLNGLDGQEFKDRFPVESVEGSLDLFRAVDQRFAAWINTLEEADLVRERQMPAPNGKMFPLITGDILHHLVNHSSYHRGQIVDQVKRLGHGVTATDYIFYVLAQGR